jgi:hypothetical protein
LARATVSQPVRYTFLLLELSALVAANRVAFGQWLPTTEPSGLWFYAALFGLLLGQRLDTPFFTAPKDAVLYAIPALVALLQVADSVWASNGRWGQIAHTLLAGWILLVLLTASIAIWLYNSPSLRSKTVASAAIQVSGALGNPKAFFSVILLLVLLAFPPATVEGLLVIVIAWAVTVPFSLLDYLYLLGCRIRWTIGRRLINAEPAEVAFFQFPGLLLLRAQRNDAIPIGSIVAFRDTAADARLAYVVSQSSICLNQCKRCSCKKSASQPNN